MEKKENMFCFFIKSFVIGVKIMKQYVFFIYILLLLCLSASGASDIKLSGKDIYENSKEAMANLTYSARRVVSKGEWKETAEQISIQYLRADGAVYKYTEIRGDFPSIKVKNAQGEFRLFPDTKQAIKLNIDPDEMQIFDLMSNATFTLKDGIWQGINCWIVTGTSNPTSHQIDEFMKTQFKVLSSGDRASRQEVVKRLQRKEFFYIAKDNFFLWKHDVFTKSGHLISSFQWDEVDFSPKIDESIFKIPSNYSIEITQGFTDSFKREASMRAMRDENSAKETIRSAHPKQNKSFHWFSLNILKKITWLIFLLSISLLAILKIKENKTLFK